jgi:hypothetical protein
LSFRWGIGDWQIWPEIKHFQMQRLCHQLAGVLQWGGLLKSVEIQAVGGTLDWTNIATKSLVYFHGSALSGQGTKARFSRAL